MPTYDVYVGGPGRGDYSRSQYPAKAFSQTDPAFKNMPIAAHKGPSQYALTRTLDFKNDHALAEFVRNQSAAGAPLTDADVLGIVVIPANTLFYGVHVDVENPVAGVTLTLRTRAPNSIALGTVDAGVAGSDFRIAGTAAAGVTEGAVDLGVANFANVPRMLEVVLTAVPDTGMGDLRVSISPLLSQLKEGQY